MEWATRKLTRRAHLGICLAQHVFAINLALCDVVRRDVDDTHLSHVITKRQIRRENKEKLQRAHSYSGTKGDTGVHKKETSRKQNKARTRVSGI